jgi:hypothetical protein
MRWHEIPGRLAIGLTTLTLAAGCVTGSMTTLTPASPSVGSLPPSTFESGSAVSQPGPATVEPGSAPPHSVPTHVPTATGAPRPSGGAGLVVRLTWVSDVMVSIPGTTILDDGRVIWAGGEGGNRLSERRLTEAGLAWVRARLDETGLLSAGRSYRANLKPGAVPDPRGATSYLFQLEREGTRVAVDSGDPGDLTPPAAWVIPPELQVLTGLARDLQDPVAWIEPAMWAGPAEPFKAQSYLLIVDTKGSPPGQGQFDTDISDITWPLQDPIAKVGASFRRGAQVVEDQRCLVVSADVAASLAGAEKAVGRSRDLGAWLVELPYRWDAAHGNIVIATQPLLPYQSPDCTDTLAW